MSIGFDSLGKKTSSGNHLNQKKLIITSNTRNWLFSVIKTWSGFVDTVFLILKHVICYEKSNSALYNDSNSAGKTISAYYRANTLRIAISPPIFIVELHHHMYMWSSTHRKIYTSNARNSEPYN